MLKKIIRDLLIGIIGIIIINLLGQYINLHIPLNILTILLVGVFRVPGLILILLILIL
jgi:inhibitor of the pro-sigma K processing machinery